MIPIDVKIGSQFAKNLEDLRLKLSESTKGDFEAQTAISQMYPETAKAKVEPVISYLSELLEGDGGAHGTKKYLLFGHHQVGTD